MVLAYPIWQVVDDSRCRVEGSEEYNTTVKTYSSWAFGAALAVLVCSACALPQAPTVAFQPNPTETPSATPLPLLQEWRSPDGSVSLSVPTGWQIEHHEDAGRTMWIWNAPDRRGLLSVLIIASPTLLAEPQRRELLLQAVAQLDATPQGEVTTSADGTLVLEARAIGTSSSGGSVPMWVRVSAQQFEDSEAIVVLAMPSDDSAQYIPLAPTVQASLGIVPLPTLTPLPTATPAPFTRDTFDADEGRWFIGDDLRRAMTIQDGVYHMYLRMAESYYLSAPAEVERTDQSIQVNTRFDGVARIGVAVRFRYRADESRDYVACWISPIQRYGCFRSEGDVWTAYKEIDTSDVIIPDGENMLDLAVVGSEFVFRVNGTEMATFAIDIPDPGVPALYVETFDSAAGGFFDTVETK